MSSRIRILLVDDEPLVLEMFEQHLAHRGYVVTAASESNDAQRLLTSQFFDIILTDVRLDGLDGFALVSSARHANPRIGAVLITGRPEDEDRMRAEKMNAVYLSKPLRMEELTAALDKALAIQATAYQTEPGREHQPPRGT